MMAREVTKMPEELKKGLTLWNEFLFCCANGKFKQLKRESRIYSSDDNDIGCIEQDELQREQAHSSVYIYMYVFIYMYINTMVHGDMVNKTCAKISSDKVMYANTSQANTHKL